MTVVTLEPFSGRPALTHLKRLTTKDGLVQHADLEVPDPSFGYSIDDNARALIVCLWHYQLFQDRSVLQLADIYFHYLKRVEKRGGTFHNFLSFSEQVLDNEGSEDSIGRAIWSLAVTTTAYPDEAIKREARKIINRANLEKHAFHSHFRAKSFILLGATVLKDTDEVRRWADLIVDGFQQRATDDWFWFEEKLTYSNGTLPYALSEAYRVTQVGAYLGLAKKAFDWLDTVCRHDGRPAPIGQNGWYFRGKEKALYDQQPLETAEMVLAAVSLYRALEDERYLQKALDWMSWYYGNNTQGINLIDEQTRGVYDALTPTGSNLNQGAESIVTYLLAYLSLNSIAQEKNYLNTQKLGRD